jgi:sialic acid synthase SpsE
MACSHEGDPACAQPIIDGAIRAGADAIQFQIWELDEMVVPHHDSYDVLAELELSRAEWSQLADRVRDRSDLDIIACIYERSSVDFAETIGADAYKIHSADVSNPHLLRHVARTGKRIDLSVGGSTLDEIQAALQCIGDHSDSDVWLMYGYQNFPTRPDDVHLDYMMKLRDLFELPIGYQDHSDATTRAAFSLPAAAVGMGVDVLEKHITHDRSFGGADHEAALNPDEFEEFVEMVRTVDAAKGRSTPRPFSEAEEAYRRNSKKSIVAARDLEAGEILKREDVVFRRSNDFGIPPDQTDRLVGRSLARDVVAYHLIEPSDVT